MKAKKTVSYTILAVMVAVTLLSPVAVVVCTAIAYSASLDGLTPMAEGYVDLETGRIVDTDFNLGASVIAAVLMTGIGWVFTIGFLFVIWLVLKSTGVGVQETNCS